MRVAAELLKRKPGRPAFAVLAALLLAANLSCEDTGVNAPSTGSIVVTANPGTLVLDPPNGVTSGKTLISARVFDADGNTISGINVNFSTTAGRLASSANDCAGGICARTGESCTVPADCPPVAGVSVLTDSNGVSNDTLTLSENDPMTAEVTAYSATLSNMVEVTVTEVGVSPPPEAVAFPNPPGLVDQCQFADPLCQQEVNKSVLLDGSDSTPAGSITCYQWAIDSSDDANDEIVQGSNLESFFRTYTTAQSLSVILRVSDDPAAEAPCDTLTPVGQALFGDSASFVYEIVCANNPPVADAGANKTAFLGGAGSVSVSLSGSLSSDSDGVIDQYTWDCGGPNAPLPLAGDPTGAMCSYNSQGVYTATLTVRDNGTGMMDPLTGGFVCEKSASDTVTVTINP